MSSYNIDVRQYDASVLPPIDVKEVWRYSGCRSIPEDQPSLDLMDSMLKEYGSIARPRVCFAKCDRMPFETDSKGLARVISGSDEIIVFAATVGIEFDRVINRFKNVLKHYAIVSALSLKGGHQGIPPGMAIFLWQHRETFSRCFSARVK